LTLTVYPSGRDAGKGFLDRTNKILDGLFLGLASRRLASERQKHGDAHDRRLAGAPAELPGLPPTRELRPRHLKFSLRYTVE